MKIPAPVNIPRMPELTRWLNQFREYCLANEIKPSPDIKVNKTTGGTTLSPASKPSGSGTTVAPATVCPFDITLTPQASPSTLYDVTFLAGTVNSMVPSGMMSTFTYDPATTAYVKINCGTNGKTVTSAAMALDTSLPTYIQATASGGQTSFDITLFMIAPGAISMKTIGWCGSIQASLQEVFLADKASPNVGEAPYTRWYQWILAAA